ncbi:MAG: hypothetical protein HZC54_18335 [Verrucomicrobia bacterium]|nr:hypothetical protein [Verrucomicrobiota bacterium]
MRASIVLLTIGAAGLLAVPRGFADEPWDGGRTVPVHRIPLNDCEGEGIVPCMRSAKPVSMSKTCGTCHDYAKISAGWHFNSSSGKVPAGRPGEPWVLVDGLTGTQLPLSYRGWAGTWNPAAVGMTPWDFTKQFARHMPGGDTGEPADVFSPGDSHARWTVSGKLEANCFACHNGSHAQDHSEWVRQIGRENFAWAATAASGLGEVGGMASRVKSTWTMNDGPNPDDSEYAVPPYVKYMMAQFDSKNRPVLQIERPPDQNCLNCHSVSPAHAEKKDVDADVHSRAGFKCVDCHRNNISHAIVRGYETEAADRKDASVGDFSCRGCHIEDPAKGGGRLGAPHPKHGGLPPVHFEKLSCTACHSGLMPGATPTDVRASRANRLGIHGRALWFTDAPFIQEPVFAKGSDGKIAPHRVMWPAFWARRAAGKLTPMRPDELEKSAKGILDAGHQIGTVLKAIAQLGDELGEVVFVASGKLFRANTDGEVDLDAKFTPPAGSASGFVLLKDGKLSPLVSDFDAAAAQLEPAVETRLLDLLQALAPDDSAVGAPALARGKKIYTRSDDGSLTTSDSPEARAASVWGRMVNEKFQPIVPDFAVRAVVETAGTQQSFIEEQLVAMLQALAATDKSAEFVYVGRGYVFALGKDGKLTTSSDPAAEPVFWPVGHNVRSAVASLGAKACTECHSTDAAMLFGRVVAGGPLKTKTVAVKTMVDISKLDGTYNKLFGFTFTMRPLFKMMLWGCGGLMAAVLGVGVLGGLQRFARYLGRKD